MNRLALIALLIAIALSASGCSGSNSASPTATSSAPNRQLTDLHDISQLRTAFNTASKQPRLIVLVSPT